MRDELAAAQQRLQDREQEVVTLEEQNRHLQFMSSIRKYDQDEPQLVRTQTNHMWNNSTKSLNRVLDTGGSGW